MKWQKQTNNLRRNGWLKQYMIKKQCLVLIFITITKLDLVYADTSKADTLPPINLECVGRQVKEFSKGNITAIPKVLENAVVYYEISNDKITEHLAQVVLDWTREEAESNKNTENEITSGYYRFENRAIYYSLQWRYPKLKEGGNLFISIDRQTGAWSVFKVNNGGFMLEPDVLQSTTLKGYCKLWDNKPKF